MADHCLKEVLAPCLSTLLVFACWLCLKRGNFACRIFAYRHPAQGLSQALSAFSIFMIDNLDKVIKANQCAQYMDDIGIAANDADHLSAKLRATFKGIQGACFVLTMHKRHFGATEIDFFGRTITPQDVKPQNKMYRTSLKKPNFRSRKFYNAIWDS